MSVNLRKKEAVIKRQEPAVGNYNSRSVEVCLTALLDAERWPKNGEQ